MSSSESGPEDRGPVPFNADSIEAREGCCTACCTYSRHSMARNDSLLAVAAAWPYLPEHVRQAIATLVESVRENQSAT